MLHFVQNLYYYMTFEVRRGVGLFLKSLRLLVVAVLVLPPYSLHCTAGCFLPLCFSSCLQIIQPRWHGMVDELKKAVTVDDVVRTHGDFLDACLRECLLTNHDLVKVCSLLLLMLLLFTMILMHATPHSCLQLLMRLLNLCLMFSNLIARVSSTIEAVITPPPAPKKGTASVAQMLHTCLSARVFVYSCRLRHHSTKLVRVVFRRSGQMCTCNGAVDCFDARTSSISAVGAAMCSLPTLLFACLRCHRCSKWSSN